MEPTFSVKHYIRYFFPFKPPYTVFLYKEVLERDREILSSEMPYRRFIGYQYVDCIFIEFDGGSYQLGEPINPSKKIIFGTVYTREQIQNLPHEQSSIILHRMDAYGSDTACRTVTGDWYITDQDTEFRPV